jgi:hypothetical protein
MLTLVNTCSIKILNMGRNKMYGEDTVLFSRRVPKSKEDEIEKIVDTILAPLVIKRKMKRVDLPPVKAIAPTPLIKDSKTGAITYPCGCFDDGEFHIPNGCQLGDKSDHAVYYWDEK